MADLSLIPIDEYNPKDTQAKRSVETDFGAYKPEEKALDNFLPPEKDFLYRPEKTEEQKIQPIISPARNQLQDDLRKEITQMSSAHQGTSKALGLPSFGGKRVFQEKGIRIGENLVSSALLEKTLSEQK
jgi:hypothetical protein